MDKQRDWNAIESDDAVDTLGQYSRPRKHQVLAFWAITNEGRRWYIPFSFPGPQDTGKFESDTFTLRFQDQLGSNMVLTMVANKNNLKEFERLITYLGLGTLDMIRPHPSLIKSITVEEDSEA